MRLVALKSCNESGRRHFTFSWALCNATTHVTRGFSMNCSWPLKIFSTSTVFPLSASAGQTMCTTSFLVSNMFATTACIPYFLMDFSACSTQTGVSYVFCSLRRHSARANVFAAHMQKEKKHNIFSSQLRADQMPGPPWEVQLTDDFLLRLASSCISKHQAVHIHDSILWRRP